METSLTHLQLEVGLCSQVLSSSLQQYGHLGTDTLTRCRWAETPCHSMFLKDHKSAVWTQAPQGPTDISIMELAIGSFCKYETVMINHCRLYLRVVTMYDLYIYVKLGQVNKYTPDSKLSRGFKPKTTKKILDHLAKDVSIDENIQALQNIHTWCPHPITFLPQVLLLYKTWHLASRGRWGISFLQPDHLLATTLHD